MARGIRVLATTAVHENHATEIAAPRAAPPKGGARWKRCMLPGPIDIEKRRLAAKRDRMSTALRWNESEPPKRPTETNAPTGSRDPHPVISASGSRSPSPKTQRNRGNFSVLIWMYRESLYNRRLNGGGGSPRRTRLWGRLPDSQGKNREIVRNQTPQAELGLRFWTTDAKIVGFPRVGGLQHCYPWREAA
jgi:hypothetical protein